MTEHRSEDAGSIHITRTIPLWSLVSMLGICALQAVLTYSQVQQLAASQKEMASDIKATREKVDELRVNTAKLEAQVESMERRVSSLEQRIPIRPSREIP